MFDHEQAGSDQNRKLGVISAMVDGKFMRRLQRVGRSAHRLSARGVAAKFGVTRSTFKAWESGKKRISDEQAERARSLYREWIGDAHARAIETRSRERDVVVLTFARGVDARMRSLKVSCKPRKCRVCRCWFEPHQARQVRCSECARAHKTVSARKRKGKK